MIEHGLDARPRHTIKFGEKSTQGRHTVEFGEAEWNAGGGTVEYQRQSLECIVHPYVPPTDGRVGCT